MNISYLLNILDLYLSKETNDPLIIDIHKNNDIIKTEMSYLSMYVNKTYVKLDEKVFFKELKTILNKIQGNLLVNNEEMINNSYKITFNNQRQISFIGFNVDDLQIIRNKLSNLDNNFTFNKILDNNTITYDEIYKEKLNLQPSFSFGFSSFITIFLTAIWFLDIFMIALWIFKVVR